jgi:hypothetical protein
MHGAIRHLILHNQVRPWNHELGVPINHDHFVVLGEPVHELADRRQLTPLEHAPDGIVGEWIAYAPHLGERHRLTFR